MSLGLLWRSVERVLVWLLRTLVQVYRYTLSPLKRVLFGPSCGCRFHPTCSAYALESLRSHGPWRGSWLSLRRILRCHPFHPGGHDPVPGKGESAPTGTTRPSSGRATEAVR